VSTVHQFEPARPPIRLSEIDRRIFRLVAQGLTSKEIARELDRSPLTIDARIRDACARLGADTRAQAATMVLLDDAAHSPPEIGGPGSNGVDRNGGASPDGREDGDPGRGGILDRASILATTNGPRVSRMGLKVLMICIGFAVTAYFLAGAIAGIQEVFLTVLRG